jgi:hypothetical protein
MKLLSVVLVVALLLLGVRVLMGWAQREQCGAAPTPAFWLSVQALGAAPSATDCLALALTARARPASPPATTPPPATNPPPATSPMPEPEPPGWLSPGPAATRQQALEWCTEGLAEAPPRKDMEKCMADRGFPGPVPEVEQWRREGP